MVDDYQPDPDELLRAIQKEETQKKSAKLKIFFGMSAGVGKTYAMLKDAQRRLKEGANVIIGTVNTHGRKETEALLQGLPMIPEKWVNYRDTVFEEMDLEAILKQKPSIVLVDELAHTNVPGSRHAKRWQDVMEILDAGIDVYTSLNVQHIESRKDIVESIAGIQIRETVPDLLLERATTIELVDIPPGELLQRLKEGKVYLGNQSQIAARNFFKEDTLMALREIALRFTAEKVDHDLHAMLAPGKSWKTREKLMVAISASPFSVQLIRKTRRRAFELDATWIAVHVDTGRTLSDEEQTRLIQNLNLAQELGAEVITVQDSSIASAIKHIAHQKNITQLVIGRPSGRQSLKRFFRLGLVDRLENENKQLDLLILRNDQPPKTQQKTSPSVFFKSSIRDYVITLFSMVVLSGIGVLIHPFISSHRVVGFTFLLGILFLSFFLGPGPIFLAAVLSSLIWNFIFIPPMFSFTTNPDDLVVTVMYVFTATLVGTLTYRTRQQEKFLEIREKKLENLYEIEHEIANSANYQYLRLNVSSRLESIFNGKFDILVKNENNALILESPLPLLQQEKEQAAAQWVFQNGKEAGWSTSTLPSTQGLYLPIKFSKATLGVLVYYPKRERLLSLDEMNVLQTVNKQLGIYLERYVFEERMRIQSYSRQEEKLHTSIMQSISQKFYAPLNQILTTLPRLQTLSHDPENHALFHTIETASYQLQLMVENFLTTAELESGFVPLEKSSHDIKPFIESCIEEVKPFCEDHEILVSLPDKPFFVSFDARLIRLAIKNLLVHAIAFSPPHHSISIEGGQENHFFKIAITHEGPNISSEDIPLVFNKFYSFSNTPFLEERLGLAITKSVANIHQGRVEAYNPGKVGATFAIFLPL